MSVGSEQIGAAVTDDFRTDRWLPVGEAARALGMSRTTLLAAEEAGMIISARTPGGHRRYPLAEVERYLRRVGLPPAGASAVSRVPPTLPAVELAEGARAALRPLVHALDADSAGVYRLDGEELRFCAGFGIPRWLTERLTASAPPPELGQALTAGRLRTFDAGAAGFPEPRAEGTALAVPLYAGQRRLGVLFLLSRRDVLAGELRVAEAFAEVIGVLLADRCRIAELELRLHRIAELTGPAPGVDAAPGSGQDSSV
jgi:excisionase family DNA binding protein